jgi:hypothetical protein
MAKNYPSQNGIESGGKENIEAAKQLDVIHEKEFQVIDSLIISRVLALISMSAEGQRALIISDILSANRLRL